MQVNECVFGIVDAESSTDQMRYGVDVVFVHDGGTDALGTGSFAHHDFFKISIRFLFEHMLGAVVGHIDEGRLKSHQGVEVLV